MRWVAVRLERVTPRERGAAGHRRAAYSHSASVGERVPDHAQYDVASFHDTCTTGWSTRSDTSDCGPFG